MEAATTETKDSQDKPKKSENTDLFLVAVPGSANVFSVFPAKDKEDAVNQYAASAGITADSVPNDPDGKPVAQLAVIKLDTVDVNHDKVNEILNPED